VKIEAKGERPEAKHRTTNNKIPIQGCGDIARRMKEWK